MIYHWYFYWKLSFYISNLNCIEGNKGKKWRMFVGKKTSPLKNEKGFMPVTWQLLLRSYEALQRCKVQGWSSLCFHHCVRLPFPTKIKDYKVNKQEMRREGGTTKKNKKTTCRNISTTIPIYNTYESDCRVSTSC